MPTPCVDDSDSPHNHMETTTGSRIARRKDVSTMATGARSSAAVITSMERMKASPMEPPTVSDAGAAKSFPVHTCQPARIAAMAR